MTSHFSGNSELNGSEVAVIGMACHFPGASNPSILWKNLCEGIDVITHFTKEDLIQQGLDLTILDNPHYVNASHCLANVEYFDASFFGFTPRDAERMDPQLRHLLECAWEALEHAGYNPHEIDSPVGVYTGCSASTYLLSNLYTHYRHSGDFDFPTFIANDRDFFATQISYKLNLKGPSTTIQTACSTSLTSVHMACQALLSGDCTIALAGGATIRVPHKYGYLYEEGGIASPDGECRPFDAQAQGTSVGSGAGIVVLKRLADAISDGDSIHAIIKGSAVNNDGARKVGYTAPSIDGQAEVIRAAQLIAEVDPRTITYIETHGTGTVLGDPIEIAALTQAFCEETDEKQFCAIGSIKTNVGHLDSASGIAGLIKVILALKHKKIPAHLHFQQPNPQIDFVNSPFYVNTQLSHWQAEHFPRRAGVSSFGFGGTNVHVIVEEAPPISTSHRTPSWQVLTLSARTATALETMTKQLGEHLRDQPTLSLDDVAYTLQMGRKPFAHRRIVLCQNIPDAVAALETPQSEYVFTHLYRGHPPRSMVFLFPGQGVQHIDMARELYEREGVFRETFDHCAALLLPHLGKDLRHIIYPSQAQQDAARLLDETILTQPALFVVEYALAQLWMAWGIHPQAMIGHSLGEYVAACLAGVFSLEDALFLITERARLMQQLPRGAMLSISLPRQEVESYLHTSLSLAAVNSPTLCVISGSLLEVEALQQYLTSNEIACQRLHTSHAFHSSMMEPILDEFRGYVSHVKLQAPTIPFASNVTGTWISEREATAPDYWAQHLRKPVLFGPAVLEILKGEEQVFLEVGPGRTLTALVRQQPLSMLNGAVFLRSLHHPHEQLQDSQLLMKTLGRLWTFGASVRWSDVHAPAKRLRVPLPTYPFEGMPYWINARKNAEDSPTDQKMLVKKRDWRDWLYVPSWKRTALPLHMQRELSTEVQDHWLFFADECGIGLQLAERLTQSGRAVTIVQPGEHFEQKGERLYTLAPGKSTDYHRLREALHAQGTLPTCIVHLWTITHVDHLASSPLAFEKVQDRGFYSLIALAQSFIHEQSDTVRLLLVLSNNVQDVTGDEHMLPEKATILGPCKVLQQEYPSVSCRSVDIQLPLPGSLQEKRLVDNLVGEIVGDRGEAVVAYRGQSRWVEIYEPMPQNTAWDVSELRQQGVYLIIGGLGQIGLVLAEYLAEQVQAKLVLVGLTPFPTHAHWGHWLETHEIGNEISQKIQKLQLLERLGAEILVLSADVTSQEEMSMVLTNVYDHFGTLHGVIHAAGIAGKQAFRAIPETSKEDAEQQFQAKVSGLYVLGRLLHGRLLDFCLIQSSLSSILGGLGFAAYAAANLFMDAFVRKQRQESDTAWSSINWDNWLSESQNLVGKTPRALLPLLSLQPEEGKQVLSRIFTNNRPVQVLVSTGDLQTRLSQWRTPKPLLEEDKPVPQLSDAQTHSPRSQREDSYIAPRTKLEQELADIFQRILGIEQMGVRDSFFELGVHSMLVVQLATAIRKYLGREISLATFLQLDTIEALAHTLSAESTYKAHPILIPLHPQGERPPFFCVHPGHGGVVCYQDLVEKLDQHQPFYAFQAQGLDGVEPLVSSVEEMAALYIKNMKTCQGHGPYYLGGWSFGGVVAFEMAQQLVRQGEIVALLAIIDSNARILIDLVKNNADEAERAHTFNDRIASFISRLAEGIGLRLPVGIDELKQLPADEQMRYYLNEIKVVHRLPEMSLAEMQVYYRAATNNLYAYTYYRPDAYPGDIAFFSARDGYRVDQHDDTLGWQELVQGDLTVYAIPGTHETIVTPPLVEHLANALSVCLQQAYSRYRQ